MAASKSKQKSYIAGFKDISRLTADDFLRVWEHYDADGNGFIEGKELREFFTELVECHDNPEAISPQMFDEMCNCFMEAYDENADGKIEMKELAELLRPEENFLLLFRTEELRSSVEFMETWRKYDTDKSGYIEAAELKSFIKDLLEKPRSEPGIDAAEEVPETITEEKLTKYTNIMLKLFDRNGDGKLEIKEMTRLLPVKENFLMRFELFGGNDDGEGGSQKKKQLSRDEFENVFAHYDKDGNGTIEGDELSGFLKDLMEHENENVDVDSLQSGSQALLSICDVNKDGRIQKDELAMVLLHQSSRTDKD
ncbi:calbindin-like isoform X3 [Apostichopus japonicus]|uniref:calbindin-like isoform X3 n=1 Tax=Stichopus japonicus TaxID=307972 RepID=UPI003AB8C6B8